MSDDREFAMAECFGYTVATGRLFLPFEEFHKRAETLLGRPILTHEFGEERVAEDLKAALHSQGNRLMAEDARG